MERGPEKNKAAPTKNQYLAVRRPPHRSVCEAALDNPATLEPCKPAVHAARRTTQDFACSVCAG